MTLSFRMNSLSFNLLFLKNHFAMTSIFLIILFYSFPFSSFLYLRILFIFFLKYDYEIRKISKIEEIRKISKVFYFFTSLLVVQITGFSKLHTLKSNFFSFQTKILNHNNFSQSKSVLHLNSLSFIYLSLVKSLYFSSFLFKSLYFSSFLFFQWFIKSFVSWTVLITESKTSLFSSYFHFWKFNFIDLFIFNSLIFLRFIKSNFLIWDIPNSNGYWYR